MEEVEDYYNRLIQKCDELNLPRFYTESLSDEDIPEMRWAKDDDDLDDFLNIARNETQLILIHVKTICEDDVNSIEEDMASEEETLSYLEEPEDADEIKEKKFEITKLKQIQEIYREHLGKIALLSYGWLNDGVLYKNNISSNWYDSAIDIEISEYGKETNGKTPEEQRRINLKRFNDMPPEEMANLFSEFIQGKHGLQKMTPGRAYYIQMEFMESKFSLREDDLKNQKMVKKLGDAFAMANQININKELEGSEQLVDELVSWFNSTGIYSPSRVSKSALNAYLTKNGKIMSEAAKEVILGQVKGKLN